MEEKKKKIYAFDFDGTITTRDSLIAFIIFTRGRWRLAQWMMCHLPWLVLMKMRLYSNHHLKEQLFQDMFGGMPYEKMLGVSNDFAESHKDIIRHDAINIIEKAIREGDTVAIVSASPEIWVRPFFREYEGIMFLCTRLETDNGLVTGHFTGSNCYGPEKVSRLKEAFPERDGYHLIAFGDSRGDREMLEFADEGYFRKLKH
ncbi:MAG: HAD family hydrolase [Prevotella sp.]|nr:HAD family hydrolase [Prevotella sp.]